jgi:scyllo-inositol 2-dehydrogenase (NAD+)
MDSSIHEIDFLLWCLKGKRPIKVYGQSVFRVLSKKFKNVADCTWLIITLDDGTVLNVGTNWIMSDANPATAPSRVELVGTNGVIAIDDSYREFSISTEKGTKYLTGHMPGDWIMGRFHGPMKEETTYYIESIARGREPAIMSTSEEAKMDLEVVIAGDKSAAAGVPQKLPL